MNQAHELFYVTNRKLEQFLYAHRIDFIGQKKSTSGRTCWVYIRTPRFDEVLAEYEQLYEEEEATS